MLLIIVVPPLNLLAPPPQPGFVPPTTARSSTSNVTGGLNLDFYTAASDEDLLRGLNLPRPGATPATPAATPTASDEDLLRGLNIPRVTPGAGGTGGTAVGNADLDGFARAMSAGQEGVQFVKQPNGSYRRIFPPPAPGGVQITDNTVYWMQGNELYSEGGQLTGLPGGNVAIPAGTFTLNSDTGAVSHRAGGILPWTRGLATSGATYQGNGVYGLPDGTTAYLQITPVNGYYSLYRPGGQVANTGAAVPAGTYFFTEAGTQPAGLNGWQTGTINVQAPGTPVAGAAGSATNFDCAQTVDNRTQMIPTGKLNHAGQHTFNIGTPPTPTTYQYFTPGENSPLPSFGQFYFSRTTGTPTNPHIGGNISQDCLVWCNGPAAADQPPVDADGNVHPKLHFFLDRTNPANPVFVPYVWLDGGWRRVTILQPNTGGNPTGSVQYRANMGGGIQKTWTARPGTSTWV